MRGDPTRVRQVLLNLIGNAIKFTAQGSVSIHVYCEAGLGSWQNSDWRRVCLRVTDTGIGIPSEALPRLFHEFQQAELSTNRRYGGSGLGLAISRQLVEAMGGQIGVESTPGVGSTFEFKLPMQIGQSPTDNHDVDLPPHEHSLRVLCAEDFPSNQLIIRTLLEDMGQRCDIAANGRLAVTALSEHDYDLVLMDGRMPDMDGIAATRAIRSGGLPGLEVRDAEIMIVALTANVSADDKQRYLHAGMNDFLTKPIDQRALHLVVAKAIKRRLIEGAQLPLAADADAEAEEHSVAHDDEAALDITPNTDTSPSCGASAVNGENLGNDAKPKLRTAGPTGSKRDPAALAARLRTLFVGSLPQRIAELDAAWDARDYEQFGNICHGLRGSAGFVKEDEIVTHTADLEIAARNADHNTITQGLPALRSALQDAIARLG